MTTVSSCIEVAIALPVYGTYVYSVPKNLSALVSTGKRVLVPFGRRRVTGYILGACKKTDQGKIKDILDILDEEPLFPSGMIQFFRWTADYYLHPIGDVIKCALPGGLNVYDFAAIAITKKGQKALSGDSLTPLERQILNLLKGESCRLKKLREQLNHKIPNALICAMQHQGLIVHERELRGGITKPKTQRYVSLIDSNIPVGSLSVSKQKIIEAIKSQGEVSVSNLKKLVPSAPKLIKHLEADRYLSIFNKQVYRDPLGEFIKPDTPHRLSGEQNRVVSKVIGALGGKFSTWLLTGVTGSGKTEVYMHIAAKAIDSGYSVLVLVPEIALISQTERRFRARFGDGVAILHSGLSAGERYDQWVRIARGEVSIAIGARSAVFAPLTNIGIIIVDEEHDTSYKQDSRLRYNARDLAVVRAKLQNSVALLGSATPSIQSYYNVKTEKYKGVTLTERVERRSLPKVKVVDLRKSRDVRGSRRFITPELYKAMETTLGRGEQVLLFLNRRGFANYPVCSACGEAIRCKNCDISLTLHQKANAYKCHYCGFTRAAASNCISCGSSKIMLLGLGTEKVESTVKTLFPQASVARMDRDTTRRKGSMIKILKGLRNRTTDVLVGTQMVAKGHDFPHITLVGIICADLSLNFPDFRAGERTFQLLAQVAGRAGRGAVPGHVILQTYNPDHFSILSATEQDLKPFYKVEIGFRKSLHYPPFSRVVQIKISGKNKEKTRQHAQAVGDLCNILKQKNRSLSRSLEILGPIEAPLFKIAKQYRWQILLKCLEVGALHRFLYNLWLENRAMVNRPDVKVVLDVDPMFMM
ncbi:MAG: primosomal protein N' [Deltaproteobacteria bacterium]|nr:primosomal protein N' [Deltaproteobacteria bacterium]